MTDLVKITRALISVSDKTGLAEFGQFLASQGVEVLSTGGTVHRGCNVENAAYPEGSCAESNAIGAMVAAGGKAIHTIVVVGGHDEVEDCTPCGGCRQKIAEFATPETKIILIRPGGHTREFRIDDLLPRSFHL